MTLRLGYVYIECMGSSLVRVSFGNPLGIEHWNNGDVLLTVPLDSN